MDHGTYRELLTKDNMDITSSICLTNRSVSQFEGIIEEITSNGDISKELRVKLWSMQKYLLSKKHDGQIVEHILTNQPGYWIERLTLKEEPFEAAELLIAICNMERSHNSEIVYSTISEVKDFVDKIRSDNHYTNLLFKDIILQFILDCGEYLHNTHRLEIKIMQGMLYFEATPVSHGTSLVVISQSAATILFRNIGTIDDLAGNSYEEESLTSSKNH